MIDPQSVPHLPGVPVLDVDGDIIGSVDRVYIHQDTSAPLWVSIHTHFDGGPHAFAPLDDARFDDQPGAALHVPFSRAVIDDAPLVTSTDTLTRDDVHALRGYYESVATEATAAALEPTPPGGEGSTDVELVRSEERLHVSTISVPKERVRFQKVVVTEEKTVTVTVRREELRVIREPFEAGAGVGQALSPEPARELEIVLREEQVVVTTKTIPVERIRIHVAPVTEDLPVTDTVRKEHVDITTTTT